MEGNAGQNAHEWDRLRIPALLAAPCTRTPRRVTQSQLAIQTRSYQIGMGLFLAPICGKSDLIDPRGKADSFSCMIALGAHPSRHDWIWWYHRLAVGYVHSCKQGRRAMALIVMGHGARTARLQRQPWLASIPCLYLALFVDAQHDGMFGRSQIQAHDGLQLFAKLWIRTDLEALHAVRF